MQKEKLEKIKSIFSGKKKTENLVIFLVLLIIVVVAINYIWNGDNTKNEETKINTKEEGIDNNSYVQITNNKEEDNLEKKLENILSKIDGVGKVKVVITYSESSTFSPIYNEDSKISNTTESDNSGGTRTISETDNQKEVIYKENKDGSKEPVTKSVTSPKIEGAIIVAQGASSADVKTNIVQAVEVATGLATHKIQVFKMDDEKLD